MGHWNDANWGHSCFHPPWKTHIFFLRGTQHHTTLSDWRSILRCPGGNVITAVYCLYAGASAAPLTDHSNILSIQQLWDYTVCDMTRTSHVHGPIPLFPVMERIFWSDTVLCGIPCLWIRQSSSLQRVVLLRFCRQERQPHTWNQCLFLRQ